MQRLSRVLILLAAALVPATPAFGAGLQTATVQLIPCASRPNDVPRLVLTGSGHSVQHFEANQNAHAVWGFIFQVSPGVYLLNATIPYKPGHPGCVYLTRFAVLPGYDRHLVGALAPPSRIGGENYDRSVYGTLPFAGMYVTVQPMDLPHAPEMLVPVDGTMYDAELLGPHRYVLRFYLTPQDMEGTKFARVEMDFRTTTPLARIRRDLTASDLAQ